MLHRAGPPAALFSSELPPFDGPDAGLLVVVEPDTVAVVLGSAQGREAVDQQRAQAAAATVVGRRSGGGAVWLDPGGTVWVDVVLPRGHRLWDDDVGRAAWWVGEAWVDVLAALGAAEADDLAVHRGPTVRTAWSTQVCFAGLGAGEVTAGGRKVVGIAQRRTREYALFECGALLRWDPGPLLSVLELSDADRRQAAADLRAACVGVADLATGSGVSAAVVADAFVAAVRSR